MAIKYFRSEHIKVFPCQNRGTQGNSIINPAARMLSEYNLTHIADTNFESYAITKTDLISPGTFSFVLGGYYFEVSLNSETIGLLTDSYLAVKIDEKSGDSIQTELLSFQATSARESSSSILDNGTYFLGIGISKNEEELNELRTIEPIKFFDENGNQIKSTLRPELKHGTGYESLIAGDIDNNKATSRGAISVGNNTQATGSHSFAQGQNTVASGESSHTEGTATQAIENSSHAEGDQTKASAKAAHSEGLNTIASGTFSHAEGAHTTASNSCAHSEGKYTIAKGNSAHAEGTGIKPEEGPVIYTTASNDGAHAEGYCTTASGKYAHSEGKNTVASGEAAHATGVDTRANGIGSFTTGYGTIANVDYQAAVGKYNTPDTNSLFIIGDGESEESDKRHNALTVDSNDIKLYNNTTIGTSDVNASLTVNGQILASQVTNLQGKNLVTSVLNTTDNYEDLIVLGGDSIDGGSVAICAGEEGYKYYIGDSHTKLDVNDEYIHLAADGGIYCFTGIGSGMTDDTKPTLTLKPGGALNLSGNSLEIYNGKPTYSGDSNGQDITRGTNLFSNGISFGALNTDSSDFGWIRHIESSVNSGTLEIATGDAGDTTENIVFRGYGKANNNDVKYEITVPHMTGTMAVIGDVEIKGFFKVNGGYIYKKYESIGNPVTNDDILILPAGLYYVRLGDDINGASSKHQIINIGILLVEEFSGEYFVGTSDNVARMLVKEITASGEGYKILADSWGGLNYWKEIYFRPLKLS